MEELKKEIEKIKEDLRDLYMIVLISAITDITKEEKDKLLEEIKKYLNSILEENNINKCERS